MAKKQNTGKSDDMSFETALAELQIIVARMENEQQSLDASIADYEKGTELAALCQKQLDEAQLKVEKLVKTKDGHRFEPLQSKSSDA
jgi:exodeoxyribonuclease VII small subunit